MGEYNDDRFDRSRIEAKLPDADKIQKARAACRERVFSAPTMEYERKKIRFAKMELEWTRKMGKVLHSADQMVALIHLVHHATFAKKPLSVTSQLAGGVRSRVKKQTLELLAKAEVAEIEWRGKRRPLVTLRVGAEPKSKPEP